MAGRWRHVLAEDGWLADLVWWVQSPLDLLRSPPRHAERPLRRVHVDRNGDVRPYEPGPPPDE